MRLLVISRSTPGNTLQRARVFFQYTYICIYIYIYVYICIYSDASLYYVVNVEDSGATLLGLTGHTRNPDEQ